MQKTYFQNILKITIFCTLSSISMVVASEQSINDENDQSPQIELNTLLDSLTEQEKEHVTELLDEARELTKETDDKEKVNTLLSRIHSFIVSSELPIICLEFICAILFWEIIQPYMEKNKETVGYRSTLEILKTFSSVLFMDHIKEICKDIKKMSVENCKLLYQKSMQASEIV